MSSEVTIVMYHYVRDLENTRYPGIKGLDVRLFEEQILYLMKHYHIITLDTMLQAIQSHEALPEKAALLTFDDGYKDHYTYVFPILMKYDLTGVFYIPGRCFREKKVLDVNKIHFLLACTNDIKDLVRDIHALLDTYSSSYALEPYTTYYERLAHPSRFDDADTIFVKRLLQRELPEDVRSVFVDILFEKYLGVDEKAFWEELYLTKEQVQVMKKCGMYFGTHGYEHYWMSFLSKEEQKEQIELGLETLSELGVLDTQWTMCYPYGDYNADTLDVLRTLGCKMAVTTKAIVADIEQETVCELSRLDTNDLPKDRNGQH